MAESKYSPLSFRALFRFLRLLFYADPTWLDKCLICLGFVAAVAAGVPFPLLGVVFGQLVDNFNTATCEVGSGPTSTHELRSSIDSKVLLLVYIAIASFALIYTHIVCWNIASQRLAQRIRDRYLRNLLRQDITFFDNAQAGEVSSRLNGDIQAIEAGTSEKIGIFLTCISFCITAYIIAFIKDARLAGMLISLVPAFLLMTVFGGHFVQKHSTKVSNSFAKASAIASESLSHVGLVHSLGASARLEQMFQRYLGDAKREGIKKSTMAAVQAGLLYFIAFSANALAYWQGSRKIASTIDSGDGNTTVGSTYTVIFILVDGAIVLSQVAPLLPLFSGALAAFQRLEADIDHDSLIDGTSQSGRKPSTVKGEIEFRDVTFVYPSRPGHTVLHGISFRCESGKFTAIVGLSGSGKSTIASLLMRMYDPSDGSVLLDGRDIRTLRVKGLRGCVSLVPQEPSLLDRSILENIALGLVNSPKHAHLEKALLSGSLEAVSAAARQGTDLLSCAKAAGSEVTEILSLVRSAADLADAVGFIDRLDHGFATKVGPAGSLLSGGQKQRVALARALVRDPKILLLDEATAALDSVSEQRIQAAIERVSSGRTVISIAHRLSTIKCASKIIVVKAGRVLEQGSHEELLGFKGEYAEMVGLQSVRPTDEGSIEIRASEDDKDADAIKQHEHAILSGNGEESDAAMGDPVGYPSDIESDTRKRPVFQMLAILVRPYLLLLVLAFTAATIVGGTYSASGAIFGNTLGSFSPCNAPSRIRSRGLLLSGLFFMLACVEFLANFTSWAIFGFISEKLVYRVRGLCLHSLLERPLQWHESHGRSPTILLGYITNDGNALAGFSGSIIGTLFAVIVNCVAAVTVSHIIAWRISVVLLVTVPLLLGAGYMQLRSISRFAEKHSGAFSSSVGLTVEAVSNIRTVAALSLEEEILHTYRRSLKGPRKEMILQSFKSNVWLAIANSIGNVLYAFAYWWGSKNILEGRYTQTQFFIVLMAMLVSAQLWGQLFTLAPEVSRAKDAVWRIARLLAHEKGSPEHASGRSSPGSTDLNEKDIEAFSEAPALPSGQGGARVEFCNVSFAYPARPGIQVLTSLSLSVQSGQFCALVGPSGAGKSTIFALLERFYLPSAGRICINNLDTSRCHGTSFRDTIAYVPQENILFQGSIKFNIALGARRGHQPTDNEIHEACKLANIHDVIMALPRGYDTECGTSGSQLSGGQRQRLSIARALVRKPRLLLLDESTSALDAESERALEEGLERVVMGGGITVIAIAHRLRTIARADVIFVIEAGKVIDKGSHAELMQRSESYRTNALHQMLA